MKKFVELAGGSKAKIIIIPNAGSYPVESSLEQVEEFKELGAFSDYLLFTRETADADSNLKKLDGATAVFFLGGDQSDLTRDMLGTKLLQKVFDIYNKGGLVGGTSAGAVRVPGGPARFTHSSATVPDLPGTVSHSGGRLR